MKNFKVVDNKTNKVLGDFLNVETDQFNQVKIWFLDETDQLIKFLYREDIDLKRRRKFWTMLKGTKVSRIGDGVTSYLKVKGYAILEDNWLTEKR